MSLIWKDRSAQSLGYIMITIVLSIGKTRSFSWNISFSLRVMWNNLLKDFQYLPLVKCCHPLLTVGVIAVSHLRPQLVTDATHFAWIGLLNHQKLIFLDWGLRKNPNSRWRRFISRRWPSVLLFSLGTFIKTFKVWLLVLCLWRATYH